MYQTQKAPGTWGHGLSFPLKGRNVFVLWGWFYQGTYSLSYSSFKVPLSLQSICKGPRVIGSSRGSSFTWSCDSRVLRYLQKACPRCFPKASLFICCIWFGAKGPRIREWDSVRGLFGCGGGCQGGSWHRKSRRFCAEERGGILSCQGKWSCRGRISVAWSHPGVGLVLIGGGSTVPLLTCSHWGHR